jgi:hypothetical protein
VGELAQLTAAHAVASSASLPTSELDAVPVQRDPPATTGSDMVIRATSLTSVRRGWRRATDHRLACRSVDRHGI